MKRLFSVILTGLLLACLVAVCAFAAPSAVVNADVAAESAPASEAGLFADSSACGAGLSWTLSDGVLSITGTGAMYSWDSVEDTPWYSEIDEIEKIVVSKGVTTIGKNAFGKVQTGDIDTNFGDLVYEAVGSGSVGSISWTLGDNNILYLEGTGALADFVSEDSVPWKSYRDSIKGVSVAETVTGIGAYAFYGMTALEELNLPLSVTNLGSNSLAGCTALKEVYLGSVSSIPANVFTDCSALVALKTGNYECYLGIKTSLGVSVNCEIYVGEYRRVAEVELPVTLSSIEDGAFDRFFCLILGYKNTCADEFAESYGFIFEANDVAIELGAKQSSSNIRYVEIDGFQYEMTGDDSTYYICPEKDTLVEVVEKESADSIYAVSARYYFVDSETFTYRELEGLASYMSNKNETTIRTRSPISLRFTSQISTMAKMEEDDFVIEEYGFIVGVKSLIEEKNTQLNLDFEKYAKGVSYSKEEGIDLIFDGKNDDLCVFTGILINVPAKSYNVVVRTKNYTKITVDGNEFVVYGEPVDTSMYATAKKLVDSENVTPEQNSVLKRIISRVEHPENDIPGSDLFS